MARLGGGTLARGWRRATRAPGRAIVLMYHRVSDDADYLGLAVPPAVFARQLELLRMRARVVPLAELVARLADPAPLAEDHAAITFDDGWRDNLETALPILRAHGVPATVFVATGFVDGTVAPAGERVRAVCEALWRRRTPATAWSGRDRVDARVRGVLAAPGSLRALARLRQALKELPRDGDAVLGALERLVVDAPPGRAAMLDWDGVRALAQAGVEIGSHAVSHTILARMTPAEAEDEIAASKRRIESELGRPVAGFAFPNGKRGDYTGAHLASLRRAGYRYAGTAETGSNAPGCDAYRLRRIGVGKDSRALLDLKLALGRAA
jgi:peptidoglycan/xylan/chitin deacetylase (PgdA/CDA1 family)